MTSKPDLRHAYDVSSDDDHRALYRDWAATYDDEFAARHGYLFPSLAAEAFMATVSADFGNALDIGAGTGLVAAMLPPEVRQRVDALDLSAEMLAVAKQKDLYRDYFAESLFDHAADNAGRYDAIVSAGSFTLGHLGPDALRPAFAYLKPGGVYILTINMAHFEAEDFSSAFHDLSDVVSYPSLKDVPIYDSTADHENAGDRGYIAIGQAVTDTTK